MDISSPGIIWKNLTSKNRNMIRKAIKSGIAIYNGRYPEIYEHFREIYNKTMDKDHAESYYYFAQGFYESILMDLPQNAQVFYAELKGKIVAASIILAANGRLSYHLSGSLREYQNPQICCFMRQPCGDRPMAAGHSILAAAWVLARTAFTTSKRHFTAVHRAGSVLVKKYLWMMSMGYCLKYGKNR